MKNNRIVYLLLILLTFAVYANAVGNGFVSDDYSVFLEDKTLDRFPTFPVAGFTLLRSLMLWSVWRIFGAVPAPYRILNILLHAGTVCLIYALVKHLANKNAALFAGVITAVHPLFTESVSWIIGGVYAQYGFLFFLSLWLYIRTDRKKYYYPVSVLVFAAMLFTSERSAPLAMAFGLYEMVFGNIKRNWYRLLPFACLSGFVVLMLFTPAGVMQTRLDMVETRSQSVALYNPLVQVPIALFTYFSLIVYPKTLSFYYPAMSFPVPVYIAGLAALIAYGIGLYITWKKSKPSFFFLAVLSVSLLPFLTPLRIAWLVAERYAYIAAAAGIAAGAAGLDLLIKKLGKLSRPLFIIFPCLAAGLFLRTVIRNTDWRSQETLYLATEKTAWIDPRIHNNVGNVYKDKGSLTKAREEYETAVRLSSTYAPGYYSLGVLAYDRNDYPEAERYFLKTLAIDPSFAKALRLLASMYYEDKRYDKARIYLAQYQKVEPDNPFVYLNLGMVYNKIGDKDKARQSFLKALSLDPDNRDAVIGLRNL